MRKMARLIDLQKMNFCPLIFVAVVLVLAMIRALIREPSKSDPGCSKLAIKRNGSAEIGECPVISDECGPVIRDVFLGQAFMFSVRYT